MFTNQYLQWYRDKGRGQEAADALGAVQSLDGVWPIARIYGTRAELDVKWRELYMTYRVNPMHVYNADWKFEGSK